MFGDAWRFWLDALQWLVTLGLGLVVWLRKPGQAAGDAVQALRELHAAQMADHGNRLTQIEAHMTHMPDEGEYRRLEGQVKEVAQRVHGIQDSLAPIRVSVQRIEEFLLRSRLP